MALYRCSVGGGGGDVYAEGSLNTSNGASTSQNPVKYTIQTGLSSIDKFFMQGYSTASEGYSLQDGIVYDADDSGYFQSFSFYYPGSNQIQQRSAFTSTPHAQLFVVEGVNNGDVTIVAPTTAARAGMHFEWLAK